MTLRVDMGLYEPVANRTRFFHLKYFSVNFQNSLCLCSEQRTTEVLKGTLNNGCETDCIRR